ncbi:MAG TPA: tetratricopeptide repeat protein, partial [Planctomycetota bacterium]|nr:tetratricopeptide repeat protein [Planctomycetota bacterium]
MPASAQQLFETSVDQVRRGQLRAALGTLLATLAVDPVHAGALEAAGRICRLLGAADDAQLFEELAARPKDAQALYGLAYRLVDQGRPDVAVPLLQRALAAEPSSTSIRRELAFARLQAGRFAAACAALVPLEDNPDLSETERLDVLLTLAEAAFYAGDRAACRSRLEQAEDLLPDDDQRQRLDALHAQLGRSAAWPELAGLGLREWHYIQHAGVILKVAGGYFEDGSWKGRYDVLDLRLDMLAFLARRLADLLATLRIEIGAVAPASDLAAPLAWALAARLGAELVEELDSARGRPTLLVAA